MDLYPRESFDTRLNKALEIKDMRPAELAKKANVSESTISQYRSGYAKPKAEKLNKIAKALGVNPTWLIGYDTEIESFPPLSEREDATKKRLLMYAFALEQLKQQDQDVIFSVLDTMIKQYSEKGDPNAES